MLSSFIFFVVYGANLDDFKKFGMPARTLLEKKGFALVGHKKDRHNYQKNGGQHHQCRERQQGVHQWFDEMHVHPHPYR